MEQAGLEPASCCDWARVVSALSSSAWLSEVNSRQFGRISSV
jgi:hypothetical protein